MHPLLFGRQLWKRKSTGFLFLLFGVLFLAQCILIPRLGIRIIFLFRFTGGFRVVPIHRRIHIPFRGLFIGILRGQILIAIIEGNVYFISRLPVILVQEVIKAEIIIRGHEFFGIEAIFFFKIELIIKVEIVFIHRYPTFMVMSISFYHCRNKNASIIDIKHQNSSLLKKA